MSAISTGYVMLDHRASPGITAEFIRSCGKNPDDFLIAGEGMLLEADSVTCSHCQRGVILSPTRKRERYHCAKCNKYICDQCEAERVRTGECIPMRQRIEELQEEAFLKEQRGSVLITTKEI